MSDTPAPDFEITVTRTFTVKVFGTLAGYVALADSIEPLDSLDGGDATGRIIERASQLLDSGGDFRHEHDGTTVIASYEDDLFQWSPKPNGLG